MQEFLAKLEAVGSKHRTMLWYKNHLTKFTAHVQKPLNQVTDTDVYSFRDTMQDKCTQYNALRCVKRYLKFHGHNLDIVMPKYVEREVEEYSPEEVRQLFSVMNEAETRLWAFYRTTGCREQEVTHSTWESLHRHEYIVAPYRDWEPKKNKSRRVPIPDSLWNLMEPHRGTGLIFRNRDGNPDGHHLRKLHWVVIRAGMKPGCFWLHKWRSSFATTHLRNGATIHEVAAWLGHSDLTTVLRYLALVNNGSDRVRALANSAFAA